MPERFYMTQETMENIVFSHYLRTGMRLGIDKCLDLFERKFNPYHDEIGRFTSPPGVTVSYGDHAAQLTGQSNHSGGRAPTNLAASSTTKPRAKPKTITDAGRTSTSEVTARHSRGRITQRSTILPSKDLHARARSIDTGQNELIKTPNLHVVLFGPGVDLVPVPVATFQDFNAAANLSTDMRDLDAVITGQQSDYGIGSEGINGQTLIRGRVYGKSAPGLYYFGSTDDSDGVSHIKIGKGDPPPAEVHVGFGGGIPLPIDGQDVTGYNIAWNRYRGKPGVGKNIVAFDSSSGRLAIFVQPDSEIGFSLEDVRRYIRNSGYDNAPMLDGSGSTSLNYRGQQIVSPDLIRQPLIPMGIGFRSKRNRTGR